MHGGNWFNQNDNRNAYDTQQHPGMQHPGMQHPSMQHPGMQHPGMQQSYCCPSQTMPDMQEPARVSPTQEFVRTNIFNTYVPHIHPSHTTTVNKRHIHHQHYFPHTESTVEECFETNTMCGMPTDGCCPPKRRWR